MFSNYLRQKKRIIDSYINVLFFRETKAQAINRWGKDVLTKLDTFSTAGKSIRGVLVLLTADMFGLRSSREIVPLAAGLELIHSSLLIHDDIIDRDLVRRNMQSIHASYFSVAQSHEINNFLQFGESMGICAGDIALYYGIKLLNGSTLREADKKKVLEIVTDELISVGIGQMQDIFLGSRNVNPLREEIVNVYRYKTARYTFVLPFLIGAAAARQPASVHRNLERLGESLGMIFQIKDDEIGLFSEESGKPVGSDIRENKKTLMRYYLFKRSSEKDLKWMETVFGKKDITPQDIKRIRRIARNNKIDVLIEKEVSEYASNAKRLIQILKIPQSFKVLLLELLDISLHRQK